MKNVFLNLRTAKAQAGCAKLKDTSLSFRRGLGRGFLFTFLLLTFGVGQVWANKTYHNGDIIYYDFRNVTSDSGDGVNWQGSSWEYDGSGRGTVKTVVFSGEYTFNSGSTVCAKTARGSWTDIKWSDPGTGQNCLQISSDGKSFTWTTYAKGVPAAPSAALLAGNFPELNNWRNCGTMTKSTSGSVTTFTYTLYDVPAGTYEFCLKPSGGCGGYDAILKPAQNYVVTQTQTGCTSFDESGDSNHNFKVVTGSAGDITITVTYNSSTPSVNVDVTRVDIATSSSGWYMVGNPFDNSWTTTNYPIDRTYRGISGVYYRPWTISTSGQYYKVAYKGTQYGQTEAGNDVAVVTGTQYSLVATEKHKTAFITNDNGSIWCVVDDNNKKMWVQSPTTYHTVSKSSEHGTVKLKEKIYGGLETNQFAYGETIHVEIDTVAHYSIASVTLTWGVSNSRTVTMSKSGTKYVGDVVMPNSDATLTVTYTPWYQVKLAASPAVAADAPTAAKTTGGASVANNSYVISGTSVTFTKQSANGGYTWGHWEHNSNTSAGTGNTYIATITADATVTAVYTENDYTVTVNAGEGGYVASGSVIGHVSTKVTLPTATAYPGYRFVNWTTTTGSVTYTNQTSANTAQVNGLTAAATVRANFARTYAYIEGRFHVTNANRDGNWTNTFSGGDRDENSTSIPFAYDGSAHEFYLRTFATPKELSDQISSQNPYFYIKISTTSGSLSNTSSYRPYTSGAAYQQLTAAGEENKKQIITPDNSSHSYWFNSTDESGYVKLYFNQSYIWYCLEQTLEYNANGGTGDAPAAKTYYDKGTNATAGTNTFTRTGYHFNGWKTGPSSGTSYAEGASVTMNSNITLYAQWEADTYSISLDQQESAAGWSASGTAAVPTVTYNAVLPAITGTMPTTTGSYGFMGFYTEPLGAGLRLTDGTGAWIADVDGYTDEDKKWIHAGDVTLYAYYRTAQITGITFSTGYVIAPNTSTTVTATIEPMPAVKTSLCWTVLHNNDNPLEKQPTFTPAFGTSVSFTTFETSATYKIVATLRTGSVCGSGDIIDQDTVNFQVAGDHIVTVQYKCGDATIKESITTTGRPLDWSDEITAPEIFGYTFWKWVAEDGVSITTNDGVTTVTETTTATIKIKAIYDGRLVAKYQEKSVIYFKNTLGWSDVYVHFLDGSYWNATNGSGNKSKSNCNKHMTRIGETDIWYFDYGAVSITPSLYIAFTSASQNNVESFAAGVSVVYTANYWQDQIGTDKSAENGFKAATPMYVPLAGQTKTKMGSFADYYNRGYWTKYTPGTGYSLKIYNSAGNTLLKHIAFTSEDELMPMTAVVDLEANTTYKYEMMREGDVYYGNDGTMDYSNHGQSTAWDMTWKDGGHKAGLTTTASGDYTFNLSFSENSSNEYRMRIAVDYPIKNGDYRLVYTDDTRSGRLKPSAIVPMVNNGKDTVSFFVRKDKHPQVRIQKATVASGGAITWAEYPTPGTQTNQITGAIATAIRTDSVYNFNLSMNESGALSVTSAERYLGDFYIRTDAETGSKWDNYKTPSHTMTYSQYSEENSDYTHYWMAHVWGDNNTNIKFVIANDYSPCISDTMIRSNYRGSDEAFVDGGGIISAEANIRFMWNKNNNSINRAYLSPAKSNGSKFLVLRGTDADNLLSESGAALTGDSKANPGNNHGGGAHCMQFSDDENWIYEATVKVKPESYVKLYARFAITVDGDGMPATYTDLYYKGNNNNTFDGSNAIKLITGDGDHLLVRVIYDFKTDRLLAAYLPSGNINSEMDINADVMFIREHQGDIAQVTFSGGGKITDIKTAYAVMRFNKWTLNNKSKTGSHEPLASPLSRYERDLFYISFPFDVNLNEVFGFGTYGTHWIIEEYDGASRAAKGFWKDSPTFWKFITNRNGVVLHKNVGYLLALDLDELGVDAPVWGVAENETAELFFPSSGTMPDITSGNVTATLPEHTCTIVRDGADRRIADSHWNIMGVPTYVNTTNISFANTTWTTETKDPENGKLGPQFLYTWNASDNTLTPTTARGFTYHAMHAYTVQYYGNVTWTTSVSPSSVVARQQTAPTEYEWCLELQQNEKMIDRTYVRMSNEEEVTTGFEFGYDMSKDLNRNKANIYSYIGSEMVAGNSMPLDAEHTTIVPLGVVIASNGEYTFSIPDGTNGIGITLIDEETGIRTNLSALDYTVDLSAGKHDSRFWLEISPVKGAETGIDPGVDARENGVRKVMIDGILYIVKDGKLFDARGARVE